MFHINMIVIVKDRALITYMKSASSALAHIWLSSVVSAEVVSSAVDSLMSHLPEGEKLALDATNGAGHAVSNAGEQKRMKENVVLFADQAMEGTATLLI